MTSHPSETANFATLYHWLCSRSVYQQAAGRQSTRGLFFSEKIQTMQQDHSRLLRLEFFWWIFTAILAAAILFPIYIKVPDYLFFLSNLIFIVVFITITRYIFLLKHTLLAYRQYLKVVLAIACIPLFFFLMSELSFFQTYLDEEGIDAVVGHLPYAQRNMMLSYIRSEMILFGTGAMICCILFPLRMIRSVWTLHNRGRV